MSSDIEDDLNTDKEDDLSGDTEDDSDADNEDDFDPSLDFSEIDDNAFDPSLDFSEIDDNAFDPSLDFSKIDDNAFDPSLDFSKIDDNAFDPSLDFSKIDDNAFDPSLDFSKVSDNDFDPSLDFNENEGKLGQNELGKELDLNQPISNESNTEVSSEQFGPNESESSEEKEEFNPNSPDGEIDNFEQEGYSEGFHGNFNAESMNTVLLSENLIYAALKEYIEFMVENETETEVQGEQVEVDNSKEEISELEEFLNEERERIRLEQQQAELDEGIESEPNANEEEIEEVVDQEQEIGIQENISEEMVPNNEEEVENLETKLEDELQSTLPNEGIESGKVEEIEEKYEEQQPLGIEENIEGREKEFKVDDGKYEQRQFENQIEEKHDIESETIAHEKELELIKEEQDEKEDHDEFIKEGELDQIIQELEVIQEISSNETEVLANEQQEELEHDQISPYKKKLKEIEEYKDFQQELEEILEQTRKIEQETLIEVEYNQESGKDPIYANEETIESNQWLEQKKESEEKQEHLQIQEEYSEVLKKEIERESDEGINPKLQLLLKEIIENYNFLENLTTKFKELYGSAQNKQISKTEKKELKLLINSLKNIGPKKFMFFASIKAIKRYTIKEGFSDKANLNHILNNFFTKFLQKNLVFKTLLENQKVKPITHEEKGLSTKAWGALRKLVWTETDKYIKGRLNVLRELAIEKYSLLTKHVLNKISITLQLSKQKLSKERIGLLKKAIIAIYLLNLDNPPSQAEIRRVSGFGGNYQVKQIRQHLKVALPVSIKNRVIYDNSEIQVRECSNCHEIKSYTHYTRRKQSGKLRAECNQCRSESNSIRRFQRKLLAFIYVTLKNNKFLSAEEFLEILKKNGKFSIEVKCSECGLDVYSLPSLELHHNDPSSKEIDFQDLVEKKIEVIINTLEAENVDILCSNCHRMYHATDFDKYKQEILEETYSVERVYSVAVMKIINGYLTKRKVIEDLSNGKCSSCCSVGLNMLPALSLHHLDPSKKTIKKPSNYLRSHRNVEEMVELMKKEKCVPTCENCHRNQRSIRFFRNKNAILKKFLDL